MGYMKVPDEYNFSTKFSTYIIAYCVDTESWFVTNNRFFYYEYDKEFKNEEEAIKYFRENVEEFFMVEMKINNRKSDNNVYFENTKEMIKIKK